MKVIQKKRKLNKTTLTNATLALAATAILGQGIVKGARNTDNKSPAPTEQTANTKQLHKNQKDMTYGEYREMLNPITPYVMLELMLTEGVKLDKTGEYCIPYKDSRGIWTIAFGMTSTRDGKKVTSKTTPIPIADAWDESVNVLENRETYFMMYCYDVGCDSLRLDTPGRQCAFASIFYNSGTKLMEEPENKNHRNRNETLRKLYREYGDNVTAEMVRECFAKYPITEPRSFGRLAISGASDKELADILGLYIVGGRGLWSRRWMEGQVLMGNINPKSFLNLPMGTLSEFMKMMGGKKDVFWGGDKDHPVINMETLTPFDEWLADPVAHDGKTKFSNRTIGNLLNQINPDITEYFYDDNLVFGASDANNDNKTADFFAFHNEMKRQAYKMATSKIRGKSRVSQTTQARTAGAKRA